MLKTWQAAVKHAFQALGGVSVHGGCGFESIAGGHTALSGVYTNASGS